MCQICKMHHTCLYLLSILQPVASLRPVCSFQYQAVNVYYIYSNEIDNVKYALSNSNCLYFYLLRYLIGYSIFTSTFDWVNPAFAK